MAIGGAIAIGLGVIGTIAQLDAQSDLAELSEDNAARQAAISKGKSEFALQQHRKDTRRLLSTQRASYGKSGVTLAGSPQDIARVTEEQAAIEAYAILWGGKMGADTAFFEGKIASQAAEINQYTTIMNSASSIYNILKS